jgi:hypothetical protein
LLGAAVAHAEDAHSHCYTAASFQGPWAVAATYGANVAVAMGRRIWDENGKFTGTFVLNAPTPGSPTGERTVTNGTQTGYFSSLNCDGTGTVTRLLNGTLTQVDDFLVTKADVKGEKLIVTEFVDLGRGPSALVPGGLFVRRVHTRLPN